MNQFVESRRGLINWFEAGLELYSLFSLSESLKSYLIMSEFLILAEVNVDNIHKYIIIGGMYKVKFISFTSMDLLVKILTCIFYDKAKRLFHEYSNLNCQTLLSWLHLYLHSLMTFLYYSLAGS